VDAITKVKRNAQDRPAQDIKVNGISIDTVQ
jgi:hypothetical protein